MEIYFTLAALWTLYMVVENYFYVRPQGRPYFVGLVITHFVLFFISFPLSLFAGILNDRIRTIMKATRERRAQWLKSGRKKLIG